MAYTFRLAQGYQTGKSLVEADKTDIAKAALAKAEAARGQIPPAGGRCRRRAGQDRQAGQEGQAGHRLPKRPRQHRHELPG